jgi:enterobactin synthetase component D
MSGGGFSVRTISFVAPHADDYVGIAAFELGPVDEMLEVLSRGAALPPSLERAVPKRKAEFLAGRLAASMSLAASGCATPGAVGRGPNGAPSWPDGYVGSLTHGGGVAAAVTAPRLRYAALGIDAEYLLSQETENDVRRTVARPSELSRLEDRIPCDLRPALLTLVFSAKESLFKCLHPLVGEFFEFQDAEIVTLGSASSGAGEFCIRLERKLSHEFDRGWEATGRFAIGDGRVQTAIGIRAGQPPSFT